MRYLVTTKTDAPFLTEYFDAQNHFSNDPDVGMVVFDLQFFIYTSDGINWEEIDVDQL